MVKTSKELLLGSLREKGFSESIIGAFEKVKREEFIPENLVPYAYDDVPIPLGDGSTTSQPYTIAFMLSILDPKQNYKILELGSGSGYVLALISDMIKSGEIYGIELSKRLAVKSRENLIRNSNIEIFNRSAESGFQEKAPFDRILVSFSCPDMALPNILIKQLDDPGILVVPIRQSIFQFKKENKKIHSKEFPGFAFVPFR